MKKTVYDNLAFVMRAVGAPQKEIRKRIPYVLHLVDLEKKADSYPTELSGGEQQRLSLLRALIVKPDILLLDEMTSGLAPVNAHWMIALLKAKLPQTAILLVTHQQSLWPLADHIINLQGPAHGQSVHSVSQM